MKLLAFVPIVLALSGCLSCEPLLEVRHCLDSQCTPSSDAVELTWNATLAAEWPQVDAAMVGTPLGEHHHEAFTQAQEADLWAAFGITGDEPELIIHTDDGRFRVRVLTCD